MEWTVHDSSHFIPNLSAQSNTLAPTPTTPEHSNRKKQTLLLCLTTFAPNTFYARHLLPEQPFTPDTFYTRKLLHKTSFTPSTFYRRNFAFHAHFYTKHSFNFSQDIRTPFTTDSRLWIKSFREQISLSTITTCCPCHDRWDSLCPCHINLWRGKRAKTLTVYVPNFEVRHSFGASDEQARRQTNPLRGLTC